MTNINTTDRLFIKSIKSYIGEDGLLKDNNGIPLTLNDLVKILKIDKGKCWSNIQKLSKQHIIRQVNNGKQKNYYVDIELIQSILYDNKYSKTKDYANYIGSLEWRNKRTLVIQRDNFMCQQCGSKKELRVHHKTYEHFKDEPLEELTTLCVSCHNKLHYKTLANG